jgi:hypothetical protein
MYSALSADGRHGRLPCCLASADEPDFDDDDADDGGEGDDVSSSRGPGAPAGPEGALQTVLEDSDIDDDAGSPAAHLPDDAVQRFERHSDAVVAVAWAARGVAVTGSMDETAALWRPDAEGALW